MGWRRTGNFHAPQEICVMTCDVCERDIGHTDGRRADAHYEVRVLTNAAALGEPSTSVYLCSVECLRAFALRESESDKPLYRSDRSGGERNPWE